MSEKRFIYCEEDIGQMLIPQCRDNGKTVARSVYECVDLLNELHEEITHLKEVIRRYDYSIDLKNSEINNLHLNYLKLEKENEQLKQLLLQFYTEDEINAELI